MKARKKFKTVVVGLAAVGALALSANAQAITINVAAPFNDTLGHVGNPVVITVTDPGQPGAQSGFFLDTINFDLGLFTRFNMTSTATNISFFESTIFENVGDAEIPLGNGYIGGGVTFTDVLLADLGQPFPGDYHLHPAGIQGAGGGRYTLTMWGSAPIPVPAAVYLFGTGLVGLAGLARRRMRASA